MTYYITPKGLNEAILKRIDTLEQRHNIQKKYSYKYQYTYRVK